MFGIVPFLVNWLALSQWISTTSKLGGAPASQNGIPSYHNGHSISSQSYWSLLSDFQSLPEEEVELFLPQICNILLDRENQPSAGNALFTSHYQQIYHYLENMVLQKCAKSLPFGIKCCNLLRACTTNGREGLFKSMFMNSQAQQKKHQEEETYHRLLNQIEYMTAHGEHHLPLNVKRLRYEYYQDFQYLIDILLRIGLELKSYPVAQRPHHLQQALHQCNQLFFYRMYTQTPIHSLSTTVPMNYFQHIQDSLSVDTIASLCPAIAYFGLHFPLQSSHQPALRLLRFLETECEILPSKEHCPYRVIVECIEQPFLCKSDELFTEGTRLSLTQAEQQQYLNPQIMPTIDVSNEKELLPPDFDDADSIPFYETNSSPSSRDSIRTADDSDSTNYQWNNSSILSEDMLKELFFEMQANDSIQQWRKPSDIKNDPKDDLFVTEEIEELKKTKELEEMLRQTLWSNSPSVSSFSNHDRQAMMDLLASLERMDDERTTQNQTTTRRESDKQQNATPVTTSELRGGQSSSLPAGNSNTPESSYAQPARPHKLPPSLHEQVHNSNSIRSPNNHHQFPSSAFTRITAEEVSTSSVTLEEEATAAADDQDRVLRPTSASENVFGHPVRVGIDHAKQQQTATPFRSHHSRWRRPNSPNTFRNNARRNVHPSNNVPAHFRSPPPSNPIFQSSSSSPSSSIADDNRNTFQQSIPHHLSTTTTHPQAAVISVPPTPSNKLPSLPRQSTWAEKKQYLQSISPFGHLPGYKIRSFMIKTGDDIRKEQLAIQLLAYMQKVFQEAGLDIYLRPYQIVCMGKSMGLMEYLEGTRSVDTIKKLLKEFKTMSSSSSASATSPPTMFPDSSQSSYYTMENTRYGVGTPPGSSPMTTQQSSMPPATPRTPWQRTSGESHYPPQVGADGNNFPVRPSASLNDHTTPQASPESTTDIPYPLKDYFRSQFGEPYSVSYHSALHKFMKSLVGYSLFTYLVQVKDRHNGNILIDEEGHIIHIDFGFILGDSPGFNLNFESAPFKLPREYVDLLGGLQSPLYAMFEELFVKGFTLLQQHVEEIASIIQLFYGEKRKGAADALRSRLLFPRSHTDIYALVDESLDNWRTRQYDYFQQRTNNILM